MGTLAVRPLTSLDLKRIMERLAPWEGRSIIELFAGKAQLSQTALKAGVTSVLLIEKHPVLATRLKQRWRGDSRVKVWQLDFRPALRRIKDHGWKFDLCFIDPPFDLKLLAPAMDIVCKYELLNPDGIMLVKSSPQEWLEPDDCWEEVFVAQKSDLYLGAWKWRPEKI